MAKQTGTPLALRSVCSVTVLQVQLAGASPHSGRVPIRRSLQSDYPYAMLTAVVVPSAIMLALLFAVAYKCPRGFSEGIHIPLGAQITG